MTTAGQLRHRITFQRRLPLKDDYGNTVDAWEDQFTVWARLQPRFGGEAVQQERLAGRQPYTITVRSSSATRQISTDWRAADARSGKKFNIRAIANPDERNQFLELLVDEGVAT